MEILSHGIIHGDIIKLQSNLGLQEGQEIEVIVKTVPQSPNGKENRYPPGKRAFNWTEQDDQILAELYRLRQADTGRETPE